MSLRQSLEVIQSHLALGELDPSLAQSLSYLHQMLTREYPVSVRHMCRLLDMQDTSPEQKDNLRDSVVAMYIEALQYRSAVIEALVVSHIYQRVHEEDAERALADLIAWETKIALDPAVSSDAVALVESGKQFIVNAMLKLMASGAKREG